MVAAMEAAIVRPLTEEEERLVLEPVRSSSSRPLNNSHVRLRRRPPMASEVRSRGTDVRAWNGNGVKKQ